MNKVFKFLKKYQLIIVLAIIAGVLVGYKLFFSPADIQTSPQIYPTPSPTPLPTQLKTEERGITEEEFIKEIISKYPLTPFLPYPEGKYIIKYTAPKTIEIKANEAVNNPSRQEVLSWIENQGINPDSHTINWDFK